MMRSLLSIFLQEQAVGVQDQLYPVPGQPLAQFNDIVSLQGLSTCYEDMAEAHFLQDQDKGFQSSGQIRFD